MWRETVRRRYRLREAIVSWNTLYLVGIRRLLTYSVIVDIIQQLCVVSPLCGSICSHLLSTFRNHIGLGTPLVTLTTISAIADVLSTDAFQKCTCIDIVVPYFHCCRFGAVLRNMIINHSSSVSIRWWPTPVISCLTILQILLSNVISFNSTGFRPMLSSWIHRMCCLHLLLGAFCSSMH